MTDRNDIYIYNMDNAYTRRRFLGALSAGLAGATAGCLGSGSGSGNGKVESLPSPVMGNPDSDILVEVYEDFACPHCRTYVLNVLPRLKSDYIDPGVIRYEHEDFPIPVDEKWSWEVPVAARAVQDTVGDSAFWDFAKKAYENQNNYSRDLLAQMGSDVGADPEAVRKAVRNMTYRPVVE
ncbi:MAG: thioredoxin domain-containing protein, partial [Halobacteria archaeon]|nr:thioredoxin domain-containing protein [Halobacteria archaeon]